MATHPAHASSVAASGPSDVSVTIYRDPNRQEGEANRDWPGGYAFITETRSVTIPAGQSTIRFEGVADGMLPETAIVTGLPKGVREKNRDARLLSPAGLVDAFLKRSVTLRRTNRKTGKVTEGDAIIQTGPYGGMILKTAEGYEALGCSGLPERMLFDGVPEGLSPKPTLSVLAESDKAVTATVQISYLAQGFDWSANYVANIANIADTSGQMSLFAWLTVLNGGTQSFPAARLQVVAGQPNKEAAAEQPRSDPPALVLQCWPMDITSTHPAYGQLLAIPEAVPVPMSAMSSEIIVTARRREANLADVGLGVVAMKAEQEDLGDLKLYRVPERVLLAAQSQKQVGMIAQPEVKYEQVYRIVADGIGPEPEPLPILIRTKNSKDRGLGLPLPSGAVALFEPVDGEMLLAGETDLTDRAIDEDVEFPVGESPDVTVSRIETEGSVARKRLAYRVDFTNAKEVPVKVELVFPNELSEKPKGLTRGKGGWVWRSTVAAGGTASLRYALKLVGVPRARE